MKNARPTHLAIVLTFTLTTLFSTTGNAQENEYLISHEYLGQTSQALIGFVSPLPAHYDVQYYKITYQTTDVHGEPTIATGGVAVPNGPDCNAFPITAYCHGTVLRKFDVPSAQNDESTLMLALASTGQVLIAPDYLGLGDNPGRHPYVHSASEATATVDAIRAGLELLPTLGISAMDELFVTGYSQGGQAAMETAKLIQDNGWTEELHLKGAAPMSGPYDLSGSQAEVILSGEPYSNPGYIIYLLYSYQLVYGNLFADLGDVIQSPYDTLVPPYFDGVQNQYDMSVVNALLPTVIDELFVDSVLTNLNANTDHPLWLNLRDNDNFDWTPEMPLRMYYCGMDEQVPAANSTTADSVMNSNGAPDVQAVNVLNSGNHGTCVIPAFTAAYYFFDGLSEGCTFISDVSQIQEREAPKMFPNPVSSHLNVNTGTETGIFALYTSEGRKVMETKMGGGMNTLDLSQLPAGTYIAVVDSDNGWFRELVIIAP